MSEEKSQSGDKEMENLVDDSVFQDSATKTILYNNSGEKEPTRLFFVPFDQKPSWRAALIVSLTPNTTTKGIHGPFVTSKWKPNTDYVVQFFAHTPYGTHEGKGMSLYWNKPPTTTTIVYNEPLTKDPQLYAFKIRFGDMTEVDGNIFISVEQNSGTFGALSITGLQVMEGTVIAEKMQLKSKTYNAEKRKKIEQSLLE